MNRIYRLVWNRSLGVMQVTSELAHAQSSSSGTTATRTPRHCPLALAIATLALACVSAPVWSQTCTPTDPSGCGAAGGLGGRPGRSPDGGAGNGTGGDAIVWNPNTSESAGNTASTGTGGAGANGVFNVGSTNITASGGAGGAAGAIGSTGVTSSVTGSTGSAGQAESGSSIVGGGGGGGGAGVYINDSLSSPIVDSTTTLAGGMGGRGGDATATGSNGNATNGDPGAGGGGGTGVIIAAGAGGVSLINNGRLLGGAGGAGGNGGYAGSGGGGGDGLLVLGTGSAVTNNSTGSIIGGLGGNPGIYQDGGNLPGGYGGGGAGVNLVGAGSSLENAGTIIGGNANTVSPIPSAQDGTPGVGVRGWGGIIVVTDGTIAGGNNGDVQADSVLFSGGGNQIMVLSGANFTGSIQSISGTTNGGDIFTLAGDVNGSINAGLINGFSSNIKTGNSNWTLTGTGNAGIDWTIRQGELTGNSSAFDGNLTFVSNGIGTPAVDFNQTATGSYAASISGAGQLIKDGTGSLALVGDLSTFSGTFTLNQGTVSLTGTGNLQGAEVSDSGTLDISGTYGSTATVAGISGSGAVTLGSHTLVIDNAANDNFSGSIAPGGSGTGTGGVTLNGGTQTFSGSNTYLGGTTLNGGTLAVSSDANLGDSSGVVVLDGGTLESTSSFTTARSFTLANNTGGTVQTNANLTISGNITGNGVLAKTGASMLTLSGTNNYSGGTTISAGTLQGDTNSLQGNITDNAALTFNQTINGSYGGNISGSGALTKSGTGTVTLTGSNNYAGGTTISAGTLQGDTNSLQGNILDNAALVFNQAASGTYSGNISGSGTLDLTGAGTLTLDGNSSSFTGSTTVQGGTLVVGSVAGNGAALGGNVTVDANATLRGHGTIVGNVDVLSGGIVTPGDSIGTLTVNGNFTAAQGGLMDFAFGAPSANFQTAGTGDSVTVGGNLILNGATLNVTNAGSMGPGLYTVFSYAGTLTETNGGIALGTTPSGQNLFLQNLTAQKQINLVDTTGYTVGVWNANGQASSTQMGGGSGTWSTTSQVWTDATATAPNGPMSPQPGYAIFGGASGTVTVDDSAGGVTATGMQFATNGYILGGGTLTLVANGSVAPVIRVGDGSSAGAGMTATIANVIAGTAGLTKTDLGTLVLTGANTYTGGTFVNSGTLLVASSGALSTGIATVDNSAGDNATLQVDSGVSLSTPIVLNNAAALINAGTINGPANGAAIFSATGTATVNNANGGSINGDQSGVDFLNGGTVTNDASHISATGSNGNAVSMGGAGTVNNSNGASIAGSSVGVWLMNGGVVNNTGAGSSISGGSNGAAVNISGASGTVTNSGGASITSSVVGVDFSAGGTVTNSQGAIIRAGSAGLLLNGSSSVANTGTGSTIGGGNVGIQTSGTGATISNGAGALIQSTTAVDGNCLGSGTCAIYAYSGSLTLQNAGTIEGATNAVEASNGGTVINSAGGLIEAKGAATGDCNTTGDCAIFTTPGGGALSLSNAGSIIGNVQMDPGAANTVELTAGGSIAGNLAIGTDTSASLTLDGTNTAPQLYSQAVTGTTTFAGTLSKSGSGTWVIDSNDLSSVASTTIGAGTLQVGNGGTTGSIGSGNVINNGTLAFDRSDAVSYAGIVSGSGVLMQMGSGMLTLTGTNAYAGGTFIDGGTLSVSSDANLGNTVGGISLNGGTLANTASFDTTRNITLAGSGTFDTVGDLAVSGTVSGPGALIKNGTGQLALTGAGTYTGGTTINAGELMVGDNDTTGSITGNVAVGANGVLAFYRSDALDFAGAISGSGALVQDAGTLTLDGNNAAFAGVTVVNSGSLIVGGAAGNGASLGGDVFVYQGATLGGYGTIGNVAVYNGGILSPGGAAAGTIGTLTVTGGFQAKQGAQLDFDFGAPGTGFQNAGASDSVKVDGYLELDGATLNVANAGGMGPGLYNVFTYGGALMETNGGLTLGTTPSGQTLFLQNLTAQKQINLVDSTGYTLDAWNANGQASATQMGGGSGTWSATAPLWTDATGTVPNGPMSPQSGFAVFGGAAGTVTVDDSAGNVSAAGLQFAVNGYTLTGAALTLVADNGVAPIIRVGDGTSGGAGMTATINNVIAGSAGLTKTDLGTLVLAGANTFSGGSFIDGGTLSVTSDANLGAASGGITLDGGTLENTASFNTARTINFAGSGTLQTDTSLVASGTLTGNGSLAKTGAGTLTLDGNSSSFTGSTSVQAGTLEVGDASTPSAMLGGNVAVASGGTLRGHGTIVGNVSNSGTVWAGGSIGTLTIQGNYTQAANGVFEVEATPGGQASLLSVGGTASLAGTALVLADTGTWAPRTNYTVLTAAAGVSGQFASTSVNLAFLTPVLSYATNAVTLSLERNDINFNTVAQTPNQAAVATATNALGFGNPVYDALVVLDAPTARHAFDQLGGEVHASTRTAIADDDHYVRDAINQHLAGQDNNANGLNVTDASGVTAWTATWGHWGSHDGNDNASDLATDGSGFLVGADLPVDGTARLGAVLGTGEGSARIDALGSSSHSVDQHLGVYGSLQTGALQWQGGAIYGWQKVDTNRFIGFGGFNGSAVSSYRAHTAQAYVDASLPFVQGNTTLAPFANLAVERLNTPAIQENGTPAALDVAALDSTLGYGTLGLRATFDLGAPNHGLHVHASLGWQHAWGDTLPVDTMRFESGGDSFAIAGLPVLRNAGVFTTGISFTIAPNVSVDGSYQGQFGQHAADQSARISLDWTF